MPILANPRHEAFAQALARGVSADEAYTSVGFKPDRGNASRLTAKDSIRTRVDELRARVSAKLEISLQWLLERTEEARKGAMDAGQHAAAVAAVKEMGILSGIRVEKRETFNRTLADMTDAELEAIARGGPKDTQH